MEEQPLLLRKQKHREPLLCVTPAPEDGEPGDGEPNVDGAALWITGNAQACAGWVKTQIAESAFRGAGQVVFCNNPLSGALILAALFWADPTIAAFGLLATTVAATAIGFFVLEARPHQQSREGLFGYNALLVGLAMATFSAPSTPGAWLVVPVVITAAVSAMLLPSVSRLLGTWKVSAMTLPFNIACLIWFSATLSSANFDTTIKVALQTGHVSSQPPIDGAELAKAFLHRHFSNFPLCTVGEWCPDAACHWPVQCPSGLHGVVWLMHRLVAALAFGCSHDQVYAGLYGYNSSLGAMAVGGVM
jgi:urea transporter